MKIKKLAAIGGVFMSLLGNAQFAQSVNLSTDIYRGSHAIDFNNDGYTDLLVDNFLMGQFYWLENNQNKGFKQAVPLNVICNNSISNRDPYENIIGDVNDDGYPDILSSDTIGVHWMINDGFGNLTADQNVVLGRNIFAITVDLDGDQGDDLLISKINTSKGISELLIFKDLGLGNYAPMSNNTDWNNWCYSTVYTGDFNGDNKQDVFVQNDSIRCYLNNGQGGYDMKSSFLYQSSWGEVELHDVKSEGLFDIDNDGDLDFHIDGYYYINDGNGEFNSHYWSSTGTSGPIPLSFQGGEFGDMDNDGDLDFISNPDAGLTINRFNSNTNKIEQQLLDSTYQSHYTDSLYCFHMIDIDTDGDMDIVYINGNVNAPSNHSGGIHLIENLESDPNRSPEVMKNLFQVFPNPAFTYLTLQPNSDGSIMLYNTIGEKIVELNLIKDVQETIDVSEYKKGIYFLQLLNRNGVLTNTKKVIIK